MKRSTSMYRILIMSAIAALSGCDEESADPCEDTPFACECFDDTDNPRDLEEGLAEACEAALEHLAYCVDTVPEISAPHCSEGLEEGQAAIMATDMCDGNGLQEVPSGCMSERQLELLELSVATYNCEPNCIRITYDNIIWSFEDEKEFWLNQ